MIDRKIQRELYKRLVIKDSYFIKTRKISIEIQIIGMIVWIEWMITNSIKKSD